MSSLWLLVSALVVVVCMRTTEATVTQHIPRATLQCTNGMSTRSFCLYSSSCDIDASLWQINPVTARQQIETNSVKQVTCDGSVVITLYYTYSNATKSCSYNGTVHSARLTYNLPKTAANIVWSHVSGPASANTQLQQSVVGDPTMCAFLSTRGTFQCHIPYASAAALTAAGQTSSVLPYFCGLLDVIDMQCGTQFFECQVATSLTDYTCFSSSMLRHPPLAGASFYMQCSHVDFAIIDAAYYDPHPTNTSTAYSHPCTQIVTTCQQRIAARNQARLDAAYSGHTYVPGLYEQDVYECNAPSAGPPTTPMCGIPSVSTTLMCGTVTYKPLRPVLCAAATRSQTHICTYTDATTISVSCSVPGSVLAPVYQATDVLNGALTAYPFQPLNLTQQEMRFVVQLAQQSVSARGEGLCPSPSNPTPHLLDS